MAKLYFRYSSMGAGKSIDLLKVAYNYEERGQKVLLMTSALDNRYGIGKITTRIGLERTAYAIKRTDNIYDYVINLNYVPACILIDEAQFLTEKQVYQLTDLVDFIDIPVICYGLRTDFQMKLFEGSGPLFAMADKIEELKTICECGKKATVNLRIIDGNPVLSGKQVYIGGNESYVPMCRKCYKEKLGLDKKKEVMENG